MPGSLVGVGVGAAPDGVPCSYPPRFSRRNPLASVDGGAEVASIYRSPAGQAAITEWCHDQLDAWTVAHQRTVLTARGTRTHVVTAGSGEHTVVVVPGTNFCAASCLPLASALAARCRVVVVDLPGQPGLSAAERVPAAGRLAWYGRWLDEVVEQVSSAPATVLGHSLGAAITLATASPLVRKQILVSPGGLMRLRITPRVAVASVGWLLARSPAASARLLRVMHGRGHLPRPESVEWMTLVARHVRSSTDPGATVVGRGDLARTVVVGGDDVFLPARALSPVVRRMLGAELDVIASAGHLIIDEVPQALADLAAGGA